MAGGVHAVVDGKVLADEVGAHGGVFAGEKLALVEGVGLVFAVVDAGDAGVAGAGAVGLVHGLGPLAAATQIWGRCLSARCLSWRVCRC